MVVMVAMVALWDEAILELEETVSTKVIALETTVAKPTAVKTAELTVSKFNATLVKRKLTTLARNCEALAKAATTVAIPTAHTCIHC